MKQFFQMKEVLDSWRRCMEKGILRTATSPAIFIENATRVDRIKNVLLSVFEECLGKIKDFIANEYLFLLVDCDGVILKKK
jgi:transcriptional regulator of acetoin/glycerol metabolism